MAKIRHLGKIEDLNILKNNEPIFVCPFGLGDTYLVCALAETFRKEKGFCFSVVVKEEQKEIAKFFERHIKNIYTIKNFNLNFGHIEYQATRLATFYPAILFLRTFFNKNRRKNLIVELFSLLLPYKIKFGFNNPTVNIAHCYAYKNGILRILMLINKINLLDSYRIILDISPNADVSIPTAKKEELTVFRKKPNRHKAVIIFPECKSIKNVNSIFWRKLCSKLNASGFKVYVNVKYLRQNKIPNTRSIKIPLEKIIKFTEMVGNVISVRSGICDVISSSKCNLIVLYPSQNIYSWSSLKKMGLRKMVKEYIIDSPSNRKLIKQIVNNCKKVI